MKKYAWQKRIEDRTMGREEWARLFGEGRRELGNVYGRSESDYLFELSELADAHRQVVEYRLVSIQLYWKLRQHRHEAILMDERKRLRKCASMGSEERLGEELASFFKHGERVIYGDA